MTAWRLIVMVGALALGTPAGAAQTCSARHAVCLGVCATLYARDPGCTRFCADALLQCLRTGCWVTPQANECGKTKT